LQVPVQVEKGTLGSTFLVCCCVVVWLLLYNKPAKIFPQAKQGSSAKERVNDSEQKTSGGTQQQEVTGYKLEKIDKQDKSTQLALYFYMSDLPLAEDRWFDRG